MIWQPFKPTTELAPQPARLWRWKDSNVGEVYEEDLLARDGVPFEFGALLLWLAGFEAVEFCDAPF